MNRPASFTLPAIFAAFSIALFAAPAARADVPPPGQTECQGKTAGAACTMNGTNGTCTAQTCSRLDYANWDRDASSSPPTVEYPCVLCATGDAGTGTDAGNDAGNDAGGGGGGSSSNSGCSVGGAGRVAGTLAIGALPLAFALVRRRRARRG